MRTKINWDLLGIATSVACAIHCAVLPVLLSGLPAFGIIHNLFFEWVMIGLALVIGSFSLLHGYARHHRSFTPALIFYVGFMFLVLKQFFHPFENWFLVLAVPLIAGAHYYNYKLSHRNNSSVPGQNH